MSQWADRHRMLSGRASAEPGRYRTARTPYMGEIMDRLSPGDATQRIVFMKAAQVGAPLALDTAVPTPFGWTTMGEIVEGDLLYDERGRICRVMGLSPVFQDRPCFEWSSTTASGLSRTASIAGRFGTSRTTGPSRGR